MVLSQYDVLFASICAALSTLRRYYYRVTHCFSAIKAISFTGDLIKYESRPDSRPRSLRLIRLILVTEDDNDIYHRWIDAATRTKFT